VDAGTPPGGFLARLSPVDREALLAAGRSRRYSKGAALVIQGDLGDFVFVITDGRVKVVATSEEGNESVLSLRGPGELIGELSALDDVPTARLASVLAVEPVAGRILSGHEFLTFLEDHPRVAIEMLRMAAGRLRDSDRRRIEFGSYQADRRLARLLVDLVASQGRPARDGLGVDISLSQQELAGFVGASRESVVRALATLRRDGFVETNRRSVVVRDVEGLRAYAR
jgi:CRP/FNR family transcriptional regulator, cyclic AMP receptor protein